MTISRDGSWRDFVGKYATYGWAVVQTEPDGGLTPWCGVGGILSIELQVQRTLRTTETWALFTLIGHTEIYSDNSSAVQTMKNGVVNCEMANHKDADLWIQGWDRIHIVFEKHQRIKVT